jgi:hypothetical protein
MDFDICDVEKLKTIPTFSCQDFHQQQYYPNENEAFILVLELERLRD